MYKIHFVEGNSCSTFPTGAGVEQASRKQVFHHFSLQNEKPVKSAYLNVGKPQNLYRMRNLQYQPSTKCSLSKIRNP